MLPIRAGLGNRPLNGTYTYLYPNLLRTHKDLSSSSLKDPIGINFWNATNGVRSLHTYRSIKTRGARGLRRNSLPIHHIIPKHEWLERFGSLKGVNATDNTVNLTLSQHAEVHLILYELNGNENDLLAYNACVGILLKRKPLKILKKKQYSPKKRKARNTYKKYRI